MSGWKDDLIKKDICMAAVFLSLLAGVPLRLYGQEEALPLPASEAVHSPLKSIEEAGLSAPPAQVNAVLNTAESFEEAGETVEERPVKTVLDSLEVRDEDIHEALNQIALESGLAIDVDEGVEGRITIYLKDVDVDDALRIILDANNLAYVREGKSVRVMRAQDFEEQFGYPFSRKIQTRMMPLLHTSFHQVEALLNQMKSETGKIFYSEAAKTLILMDAPEPLKAMADLIKELDVPVAIKTFELQHRQAKDIVKDIQGMLTSNVGRIRLDESANHIIVTDTPSHIEEIARRMEELDQPSVEILVETKVLQIILNDEHREGIDWEAIVSDFQSLKFEGFGKREGGSLSLGTVSEEDYVILLDALDTVGMINAVSNVKMTLADGKTGEIVLNSSDLLSAYEREEKEMGAGDGQDITYHITPEVTPEKNVMMRIRPEVVSAGSEKHENAALQIQGGTTIVVGGLFKDVWVEATRKIFLLGDLPIVGFAFRNQGERQRETEIIVFLTPKVIVKE